MEQAQGDILFLVRGRFAFMEPIPLPAPIHYELLLQMLERQTMFAVTGTPGMREKVQQLIITLRKAVAQQKQLEESLGHANLPMEYRWSLNHVSPDSHPSPDNLTLRQGSH
jgi:Family of unknown function (DUF5340)